MFITGDDGSLLISENEGMSWLTQNTGIRTDLQPAVFVEDGSALVSSFGGIYLLREIRQIRDEDTIPALINALAASTRSVEAEALAQLQEQKNLLEDFKSALVEFDKSDLNDQVEKSLIRVSALAVIMFLVQVLITNYRYSLKLANFYLARAQALEVIADLGPERLSADDLSTVATIFTPTTEFGKQVDTPIDKVLAIAERIKKL